MAGSMMNALVLGSQRLSAPFLLLRVTLYRILHSNVFAYFTVQGLSVLGSCAST